MPVNERNISVTIIVWVLNNTSRLMSSLVFWTLLVATIVIMGRSFVNFYSASLSTMGSEKHNARMEAQRLNPYVDQLNERYLSQGFLLVAHYTERRSGGRSHSSYYAYSDRSRPKPHENLCHNEEIFYLNRQLMRTSSDNAIFAICWPIYQASPDHPEVPMG